MSRARILADYVAGGTTAAEFDFLDGVTSNVQAQIDSISPADADTIPHIIPDVLYPSSGNDLAGDALVATTDGPNSSTVASSKYGTVQASDGRMYYYTDIKGSKPIKDPRIGAHFGSQRHKFKSIQLLEQETATHGSNVYSVDGREYCKMVEVSTDTNDRFGNTAHGTGQLEVRPNDYIEIVGYFSNSNFSTYTFSGNNFRYSIDGTEVGTDYGNTTVTTPLVSRFVDAASFVNLGSTTLGIHTLKLRYNGSGGAKVYGIELIAQDTTSTATKSQIQIPSQNVVSYGKKFTVSGTPHYNPFAFAGDGTTAVAIGDTTSHGKVATGWTGSTSAYFDSTLDTATSLGLSAWETGGDFYRPVNGGRVVKWVDSSGNIKTSVNMMPPCATAATAGSDASLPTSHAWTTVYQPKIKSGAVDHSQAEVAKTFHFREFGNGAANQGTLSTGTGSVPDASMLSGSDDNIGYVMDDGLTSLSGDDVSADESDAPKQVTLWGGQSDDTSCVTFIGTGVRAKSDYTNYEWDATIAQNLPYGTHILKFDIATSSHTGVTIDGIDFDISNGAYGNWQEISFHQPKMPPIPEDAVVIADYMLMADFVPIGAEGIDKISKGVRVVSGTRDVFYDGGSPGFNLDVGNFMGMTISATNSTSNLSRITAFTPNVVKRLYNVDAREQAFYINDTAHSSADATTEDGSGHGSYQYPASVTLGNNIFETHGASGGATTYTHAYEIATPIHTSSHYQTFETPFLHELVGGDRNMEQTNLVVTPDGKTWDEVTRDTSYIGNFRWRASITSGQVSNTTNIPLDEHRGTYHNSTLNLGIKDFAWGYDRLICLVGGEYQINWTDVWDADATAQLMKITKNGAIVFRTENSHTTATPGTISVHLQLKRGDYVQFMGTYANANHADNYPMSHWNIVKV